MNDLASVTAFDLLPEREQERLADRAARDLLSHPMRSKSFFKRCSTEFLESLQVGLEEALAAARERDYALEEQDLLAKIDQIAEQMGISREQALAGIKLK